MKYLFCFTLFLAVGLSGFSQVKSAKVSQLSFLTGTWTQRTDWGDLEEIWSAVKGESIVNMFRCIKDGKAVFYEFIVIEHDGQLPVMKLRHFNPGSMAWEDKNQPMTYKLTNLKHNEAVFATADGKVKLTYSLPSVNRLKVILTEKQTTGKPKVEVFDFTRK